MDRRRNDIHKCDRGPTERIGATAFGSIGIIIIIEEKIKLP